MPIKKVFLSSTARDLKEYREAAYRAIEGLDGYLCVRMEDFGARDWDSDEFCRAKVGECDLFVGILGHLYGSCPEGSDQSYTEREYEAAVEAGTPRLIFVSPRYFPVPAGLLESDQKRKKQTVFRDRVRKVRILTDFNSPDDFAFGVIQAIRSEEYKNIERRPPRSLFNAPPLPEHFIPRPELSEKLKRRLLTYDSNRSNALPITAIKGVGGIGKTVLAVSLAHDYDVKKRFSDGILWANLGHHPDPTSLLTEWIQFFLPKVSLEPFDKALTHLRNYLRDKSVLFVLDDVRDADHLKNFLIGGSGCHVLITTRDYTIAESIGADYYNLGGMTTDQSLKLLSFFLGHELEDNEENKALDLIKDLGYSPLALTLAARHIKNGYSWNDVIEKTLLEINLSKIPNNLYNIYSSQMGDLLGASDDQVAADDQLGFKYYVEAFSDLIESPYTSRPLTIGIYALVIG